ncbi:MAG TPA: hypothetical protein VGP72_20420 [Planctomycetota bacterium]|jgi:hypothetical protein
MAANALFSLIASYRRRLLLAATLAGGLSALPWGAAAAMAAILILKVAGAGKSLALLGLIAIPLAFIIGAALAMRAKHYSDDQAAKLLDHQLGYSDRIANAFYLLKHAGPHPSPFVTLAIRDGMAAAEEIKLGTLGGFRWPRRGTWGVAACVLALSSCRLLYPPVVLTTEQAVAQASQEEMRKMLRGLGDLPGLSDEQKEDFKKLLEDLNISEEEMSKMSQADIMRLLNEKGITYKGGQKAKAFETVKNAMADLEFQKQLAAEIEQKNKEDYQIALSTGEKMKATRIKTDVPDEKIARARLQSSLGVAAPSESEELDRLQRQEELASENAKKARSKIGLKNNPGAKVDASALLQTSEQFQKETEAAIADPSSAAAKRVRSAHKEILKKEIEKGEIPAGTAEKLQHLMQME